MKPQELNLDSEIFEEFRNRMNLAINAVMMNLISKDLGEGTITAKIAVTMRKHVSEDGEVVWMPELSPDVGVKVGAKAKLECGTQSGFVMKERRDGTYMIASSQISMDEMIGKGA